MNPTTIHSQIKIKLNPWRYSSEESTPTEAVAAKWQYRGFVVINALSLNLNYSFLNRISLLLISNSYPIILARLGESRSRLPETFQGFSRETNPGPLGWQSDVLTTIPKRSMSIIGQYLKVNLLQAFRYNFETSATDQQNST